MNMLSRLDSPAAATLRSTSGGPGKRETSTSCRERAEADLLASVSMLNANQRTRMETSAQMWIERADMLQRVEDALARKTAETAARRRAVGDDPIAEPARL